MATKKFTTTKAPAKKTAAKKGVTSLKKTASKKAPAKKVAATAKKTVVRKTPARTAAATKTRAKKTITAPASAATAQQPANPPQTPPQAASGNSTSQYTNTSTQGSLTLKLWRGERMCLMGMDVSSPEPDFVGFSIEVKSPGSPDFVALRNRIAFSYPAATAPSSAGAKQFSSLESPFQKFRWVHFPQNPQPGTYSYRVTKQHMPTDGVLKPGDSCTGTISLDDQTYSGCLDVGFTRGYASSQAFTEKYGNQPAFFPANKDGGGNGPTFDKSKAPAGAYEWLGFEAYDLIFGVLKEVAIDPTLTLDVFAYDLDEPDIIHSFASLGKRLRMILDNSGTHADKGSGPGQAEVTLTAAGASVVRMHFNSLQHNKVLIVKRNGTPEKVLCGSTNFSFNGLYLQSNNTLVFESPDTAGLFQEFFDKAWLKPTNFATDSLATQWHVIQPAGGPEVHFCLSPHADPKLSLQPLADAIDTATTSVFFAIAFLGQTSAKDLVRAAVDRLTTKSIFSYGISDKKGGLSVQKPDGSEGIISWGYLRATAPQPFTAEFSSGAGIHEHNKFIVTDFNLPTAKVFTGSSNVTESGEKGNGDHLIMIQDPRVATSYVIQAILIFDHLHFAAAISAEKKPTAMTLQKPIAISKAPAPWFAPFYAVNSQRSRDRQLFAH